MSQNLIQVVFFDIGMTLVTKDTKKWNAGAPAVLKQLRDKGLRLGVISNTGNLTRAQLQSQLPPDFKFDVFDPQLVLLSSEVGIEKPTVNKPVLDIFRLAVQRAAAPASSCLYCSEDFLETLAAQRAGMIGARIQPPPQSDLKDLVEMVRLWPLLH